MDKRWRRFWTEPFEPKPEHHSWVIAGGVLCLIVGLSLILVAGENFWLKLLGSFGASLFGMAIGSVIRASTRKR